MLKLTFEREKIGMSKAELSRKAGLDQSLISKIESGRIKPYPSEINRISYVLGLPAEQLLTEVSLDENNRYENKDLPLTLRVDEIADLLRISRANAYELVKKVDFPSIRIGRRICIPRDAFIRWLDSPNKQ